MFYGNHAQIRGDIWDNSGGACGGTRDICGQPLIRSPYHLSMSLLP